MPQYHVDLSCLNADKREEVYVMLRDNSFMANRVFDNGLLVAAIVTWDSSRDFKSSGLFPTCCQCTLVH